MGEPINPGSVGLVLRERRPSRCPIVDTWWQTETGATLMTRCRVPHALKPGSATRPFFGVVPALVDNLGNIIEGPAEGNLVILDSWPGQARTLYGDHDRFVDTYFKTFVACTSPVTVLVATKMATGGSPAAWMTCSTSGHRMGTAEMESAMVAHPKVAEGRGGGCAARHQGQGIYVYVTLKRGEEPSEQLRRELKNWVRKEIGPIARRT